jgi:hypothetical protein
LIFSWFKYLKPGRIGYVDKPPEYDSSRIILNSCKWNNRCTDNPLVFRAHRPRNNHKSGFKWRIDYCGIFYFFIKYLKIKQEHYKNDIKPIFVKWANLTIQPLDYHYTNTFDTLFITIIDTIREVDHENMATSHLKRYKEYDLLLLITYLINQYDTNLQDFIMHVTSRIQSNVAALIPIISPYDSQQPQKINYYFLSNILRYFWAKFWEEKREYGIEIKGNALIQIPGERTISVSDNNIQLQKLKEYIDAITDEIVYTLLSFEVERDGIHRLVDDFTKRIYLIERDIRWNKGLKGRCGWERNFWGR